jgi:multiple sugar transport system permease protein
MLTTVPETRPVIRRRHRSMRQQQSTFAWLLMSPTTLFFLVFFIAPFLFIVWVSFHTWNMLSPMTAAGLSNYSAVLTNSTFQQVAWNTALYTIASLVFIPPLGLAIAALLNTSARLMGLWRTLFFSPVLISQVALALIWGSLLDPEFGPVNNVLLSLGIPAQQWLSSPSEVLWVIVAITAWQSMGYYAVIYLAGLQGVPRQLRESAQVDGATNWRSFWHVVFPNLRETNTFVFIVLTINSLQIFIPIYVLTGGGPNEASNSILLYIYNQSFQYLNMGQASAMSVVLFLAILLVSVVEVAIMMRRSWGNASA